LASAAIRSEIYLTIFNILSAMAEDLQFPFVFHFIIPPSNISASDLFSRTAAVIFVSSRIIVDRGRKRVFAVARAFPVLKTTFGRLFPAIASVPANIVAGGVSKITKRNGKCLRARAARNENAEIRPVARNAKSILHPRKPISASLPAERSFFGVEL
jgi:hypothetical protein